MTGYGIKYRDIKYRNIKYRDIKYRDGVIAIILFLIAVKAAFAVAVKAQAWLHTPRLATFLVIVAVMLVSMFAFVARVIGRTDWRRSR